MKKQTIKLIIYVVAASLFFASFLTIYFTQRKNVELDFPTTLAVAEENYTIKIVNNFLYEGEVTVTTAAAEETKKINNNVNVYFNLNIAADEVVKIKINITKGNELNNPIATQVIYYAKIETAAGLLYNVAHVIKQDIEFVGEVIAIRMLEIIYNEPIVVRLY